MAGEASPLIQKLMQIVGENPAALRELMPSVGEAAERIPMEELSTPDVTDLMTRVRGRLAEWLAGRAENQPAPYLNKPAASILRSQGGASPTAAMPRAPSPARPIQMDIMDRLPSPGDPSTRTEALPPEMGEPTPNPGGIPTMAQGPSMTSPAEMLRRPAGLERQELLDRVRAIMSGESPETVKQKPMDVLRRIKPSLMPQGDVDPRTMEGLRAMEAMPEAEYPEPAEDQPVTRQDYRERTPRKGTFNESLPERFKSEGLRKTELPPEFQEKLKQLVDSGQLEPEIYGSENKMRDILAKMYGYKPRALVGGEKVVGEAAPSRVGLMLKQMAGLSPEETSRVMGSVRPSGIMREGQRVVRAEEAAPQYQALGDTRDPKEIVADLLRGGPSPTGMSEFSQKALYPILKRRSKLGLPAGEPMKLEDILTALRSSRFLRSDQPNPARQALLDKVMQMVAKRGGK